MIGLFFLYAALSMAWSDYPFVTLKHWIKGIGDVMMVLIVLTEPNIAGPSSAWSRALDLCSCRCHSFSSGTIRRWDEHTLWTGPRRRSELLRRRMA